MSVQFDEQYTPTSSPRMRKASGMVGWLIQKEFAKNTTQANMILIGAICTLCVITFATLVLSGDDITGTEVNPEVNLDPEQDSRP